MRIHTYFLILAGLAGPLCATEDLGEAAGYLLGSIDSETVSPPFLGWEVEAGGGPTGGDCIVSGLMFYGGDSSIAQLKVTGPGILSFKWSVSSFANDGLLSCQIGQAGGIVEAGRISGDGGGWTSMDVFIPQGERTISWIYRKRTYIYAGDDAGRLADVGFTSMVAAPQTFAGYKTAHGVVGAGATKVGSRRLDTSWLMGLAPDAPMPPALAQVTIANGEARFRMRHSLRATGLMDPVFSTDMTNWNGASKRSVLVAGSQTADSVELDYIVPAVDRLFFRCDHQPQVDPPAANFAYIPPGRFLAGSPKSEVGRVWSGYVSGNHGGEEDSQHEVRLTRGFFLNKYETTWEEWIHVLEWAAVHGYAIGTGDEARGGRHLLIADGGNILNSAPAADASLQHPVTNVNLTTALKWLNAKSEMEGLQPCYYVRLDAENGGAVVVWRDQGFDVIGNNIGDVMCDWQANGYRVPTEAEWEYACRAGTITSLNNGLNLTHGKHYSHWPMLPGEEVELQDPNLDAIASYFGNVPATHPVGTLAPNAFGLYDMHGNVLEWCWDIVNTLVPYQFTGDPLVDPKGAAIGQSRVTRGGSWRTPGHMLRSACRTFAPKLSGVAGNSHETGFRYARNAPE